MCPDRQWLEELQAERPRLLYRRAALEAAQDACSDERQLLSTKIQSLEDQINDLTKEIEEKKEEIKTLNVLSGDANMRQNEIWIALSSTLRELELIDNAGLRAHDFPSDIIRMIMEAAFNDDNRFRWVAMGVCRDWRAIAQSTPSLWARVQVNFGSNDAGMLAGTREALRSGGQYPLHMRLRFCPPAPITAVPLPASPRYSHLPTVFPRRPEDWFAENWTDDAGVWGGWGTSDEWNHVERSAFEPNYELAWDYVDIVGPHVHRCTHLYWHVSSKSRSLWTWDACWLARKLESIKLDRMKVLRIDLKPLVPRVGGHHERAVQLLCHASMNLTRLVMRHSFWYPLTTSSLERLELTDCYPTVDELLLCLSQQKSLRVLKLWQVFPAFNPPPGNPTAADELTTERLRAPRTVTLPALTTLHHYSERFEGEGGDLFLSRLACPQLRRVILKSSNWGETLSDTVAFFLRSPALEQVALTILDSSVLAPVLQALTSVHEFVGVNNDDAWGNAAWGTGGGNDFILAASSPGALPALQGLSLLFKCPEGILRHWLERRIDSGHSLKTVSCLPPWTSSPTDQSWANELDGLPIEIRAVSWLDDIDWPYSIKSSW